MFVEGTYIDTIQFRAEFRRVRVVGWLVGWLRRQFSAYQQVCLKQQAVNVSSLVFVNFGGLQVSYSPTKKPDHLG